MIWTKTRWKAWLFALVLVGCGSEDPLPIEESLVTNIRAYDLGNVGGAGDIRVDFTVKNNLNVVEYRVMVIPDVSISQFDESVALTTPESGYYRLLPEPLVNTYAIRGLTSDLLDVNASIIANGTTYRVAVLAIGVGTQQLSPLTRSFTLLDQPIYAGEYEIEGDQLSLDRGIKQAVVTYTDTTYAIGLHGVRNSPCSEANSDSEFGTLTFDVDGTSIVEGIWLLRCYCEDSSCVLAGTDEHALCSLHQDDGGVDVGANFLMGLRGSGIVDDDVLLEMSFEGVNSCSLPEQMSLKLVRM